MFLGALLLLAFNGYVHAQNPAASPRQDTSVRAIEERLVALALQGPMVKGAQHQNKINEIQLVAAKRNWVNLLTVSANYNDQSFVENSAPGGYVYPKYFFGLTIPLGTILSRTEVKAAREQIEISKNNEEQLRRTVRAEVLSRYREYRAMTELITIQGELVDDVQAALLQIEDKFRKGLLPVENYTAAQRSKNDESAKLINLQLQQDLIKLDIEKMIGTSLDSVIK